MTTLLIPLLSRLLCRSERKNTQLGHSLYCLLTIEHNELFRRPINTITQHQHITAQS